MEALFAIEEALVGLAPEDRTAAAAPVLIDLVFDALSIDEDELNAVTRRGLLLAAAEGNPKESSAAGSRAALETASGLMEDGYSDPLAGALAELAGVIPDTCPNTAAVVEDLRGDAVLAIEALAVVALHRAME
jgi:hypothetical protein